MNENFLWTFKMTVIMINGKSLYTSILFLKLHTSGCRYSTKFKVFSQNMAERAQFLVPAYDPQSTNRNNPEHRQCYALSSGGYCPKS